MQAIAIEGQDSIFGQENSVATSQNSSQAQLPEPENKLDDSIDNQQQVCLVSGPVPKPVNPFHFYIGGIFYFCKLNECLNTRTALSNVSVDIDLTVITALRYIALYFCVEMC